LNMDAAALISGLKKGDIKSLARCISLAENNRGPFEEILFALEHRPEIPVAGITGPPGAGKSSLVNALTHSYISEGKKVAIIAVDPTSPFNYGSLLGDRLRMADLYLTPGVYIRSMASRGSLGGLAPKIHETVDLIKNAGFDLILIETVGVGQSEVEIAGIADTTVVVMVPEAGDEVQTMKSGVMEIADIFVVNKADREGADAFSGHLRRLSAQRQTEYWNIPVILTEAHLNKGADTLAEAITTHHQLNLSKEKQLDLMAEKATHLVREALARKVQVQDIRTRLQARVQDASFNLYRFTREILEQA
jgi:LAO/AO transport system kinase